MKAQRIVEDALERTGLWSTYEQTGGPEFNLAFRLMKDQLETWRLDGLTIDKLVRTEVALAAATASYAIGTGATWNLARPNFIEAINFVDTNDEETPLRKLSDAEYVGIIDKDLAGTPEAFWYQKTFIDGADGTVYPWPVYATSGTLALYIRTPMVSIPNIDSDLYLPDGYKPAMTSNLEVALRDIKGLPISQTLVDRARKALSLLKDSNRQPPGRICTEGYPLPLQAGVRT